MLIRFNCRGNEKQLQTIKHWVNPDVNQILYGGAKGGGKSYLMVSLIFADALIYSGTRYFIARASLNDLRKYTTASIHEVMRGWGLEDGKDYKFNGQDNYWSLANGSRVDYIACGWLPSDPDYMRFGSAQYTRGAIEEGGESGVTLAAYNNLFATLGRCMNLHYNLPKKLLITCNPSKNFLFNKFYQPYKLGTLPEYMRYVQALPTDNKMLPDDYVNDLFKTLNENQKQRLLFGNWEYDDDPTALCDYNAILDAFYTEIETDGTKYISADIAMQGRDRCVIGLWDGLNCTIVADLPKADGRQIEETIKAIQKANHVFPSNIVFDADGLGNYLSGYLERAKAFHNNGSSINSKEFTNIKSQCAFKLAELINKRMIRINCQSDEQRQAVINELGQLKQDNLNVDTQKRKLITKDEMKENLGHSPDYLDMLLMRMFFEIKSDNNYYAIFAEENGIDDGY